MAFRRVMYVLALIAALLFQITNENYLGRFLLVLCAALPLLSLALSLAGMLGCRLELSAAPPALERGGKGKWLVSVATAGGLPLARLTIWLTAENLLTGDKEYLRLILTGVARRRPEELRAASTHCGLLELRARKVRVCDYLGLFSLPVKLPRPARMLYRPIPAEAALPAIPEGRGARPSPANAARLGPGEDYDLRDYRPGDPMRSVHWKLSSKWNELIVRERADTLSPLPLLTLDRFGTPETLDKLLDRAAGMSRALLAVQRPHNLLWLDGAQEPRLRPVSDEKQFNDCLLELLGSFAPLSGPALDDFPELLRSPDGPVFRIHITPEGGGGDG